MFALLMAGCASNGNSSAPVPTTSSPTPAQSGYEPPPPATGAVPSPLRGTWREVGTHEKMALSAHGFKFFFQSGSYASGQAATDGAEISFTGSTDCPGTGTYTWTLKQGTLHFTAFNVDPCPRTIFLNGKDWHPVTG